MNYADFHLYTVAQGERFISSAFRCAISFTHRNPGLKFTIFLFEGEKEIDLKKYPRYKIDNISIERVKPVNYFKPEIIKEKSIKGGVPKE